MLRSLAPFAGCGLMMLACVALMARGRRNEPTPPPPTDEVAALRDEVARLRHLDEQRHPSGAEDPAP